MHWERNIGWFPSSIFIQGMEVEGMKVQVRILVQWQSVGSQGLQCS